MKRIWIAVVLGLACQGSQPPPSPDAVEPTPEDPVEDTTSGRAVPAAIENILPKDAGAPTLETIAHIKRIPSLGDRHRKLLVDHGFFIAPQAVSDGSKAKSPEEARERRRAKHLFQVYERNDYIRFPSYVTVDLAIDLSHRYFEAVLRRLEQRHLAARLETSLSAFADEAIAQWTKAKTPAGKEAALAAATYFGTALRLLQQPAKGDARDEPTAKPLWEDVDESGNPVEPTQLPEEKHTVKRFPAAIEKIVAAAAKKVQAAAGREKFAAWGQDLDLTLAKPRAHYTTTGTLQRYFRAMTLLGLSQFTVEGERARPGVVALLGRSYAGKREAAATFEQVQSIASFVVGEPSTAGLRELAAAMQKDGVAKLDADALVKPDALAKVTAAFARFPAHPIENEGPVMQPSGQRVFADTLAMSAMLELVRKLPEGEGEPFVMRAMGAMGSAAMLGDDVAAKIVSEKAIDPAATQQAIVSGRKAIGELASRDDAYHRTLIGLRELLHAHPQYFEPDAFRLRLLQSFAGGWAMLRHDTLLYAYQMGAECDAQDFEPPHGWVEPMPEVYAALEKMVHEFGKRVDAAGIEEKQIDPDSGDYTDIQFSTVKAKTEALVGFLQQLQAWSKKEIDGEAFNRDERNAIAQVGGFAEHVVLTLADAFELGEGNDDMAVVADVFTWRGRALEVGVAHPELVYAVIPTPDGWQLARGAVLGYREFLSDERLTDEAWRERLRVSKDHEIARRPDWLAPITAEPVGVVELAPKMEGQFRCEYHGGIFEL
jgi:hypothetical protein